MTTKSFSWSRGEAETDRIDVLLAFDKSALSWLGSSGFTAETFADEAIFEMNSSLALTGLDAFFLFRLAGRHEILLDLSGRNLRQLLSSACGNRYDPELDESLMLLRRDRDEAAADIVILLTDPVSDEYNGVASSLNADDLSVAELEKFAESAYAVVDIKTALPRYSMLHEVGHLFGAGHCNLQKSSPGPQLKSYSSAYLFSSEESRYVTVMGYWSAASEKSSEVVRLPFFSTPDYEYNGVPVGTEKKNDNTRTLRETYSWVANFRVAKYSPEKCVEPPPDESTKDGISLFVTHGADEAVSAGQEVVLNRFVTDQFSVQATAPSSKKVTVRVTGLPSGMKFTSKTGLVSGFPKKAGRYTVKVSATCKGEEKKTMTFAVRVEDAPSWLVGDYVGLVTVDGVTSLATLKVSTAGKVSLKCKCGGRSRTFSCSGFASEETGAYMALPSAKISSAVRTFGICLENRSATLAGGKLLQKPWSRKDITAPKIRKTIKTTYGDLAVKISTKGKASFSGKVNGVRVSGSSQVVASFDDQGIARLVLPITLAAKKNFGGIFAWADVQLGENYAIIIMNE